MGGNNNKLHDAIVARTRKRLEAVGCMTIHLESFTRRKIGRRFIPIKLSIPPGWPDIISFTPGGRVEFYEVKTGDAKLSKDQKIRFAELARRGHLIRIIHENKTEVFK